MRPFGCHVTILNTLDYLGKFVGKSDEGFFVGYSMNGKDFRVYNIRTRKVEENLHIRFLEDKPIIAGDRPKWLFDIDMVSYLIILQIMLKYDEPQTSSDAGKKDDEGVNKESGIDDQERPENSTQDVNTVGPRRAKKVILALKGSKWIKLCKKELLRSSCYMFGPWWISHMAKKPLGYTQEEGIDYDEMDVKSAFLYGKIEEEVYVCQPPGFEDPKFPDIVYKRGQIDKTLFIKRVKSDILLVQVYVDDIIFGSTKRRSYALITQKDDGIFISQDKYVDEILKKFVFSTVKTTSTPMETSKPLMKDENVEDVYVHLYRSMIGSLIIFRYLKGQPKLGLWYSKDSPFDLEAYTDSDYAGASLDRKSTTGGYQFFGSRLISWQCKKQTIVANSTTEAEYVAAASCYGQVLWIQNQMLDYGYNFMNTKIFIDNESTICIVKNPVFHSKTNHIEIRHHFIRDSNKKKLIQMIKINTDQNVTDLLTKAFDVGRFQNLIICGYTRIPPIFTSVIKQFWATAKAKTVNGEVHIQAYYTLGFEIAYVPNTFTLIKPHSQPPTKQKPRKTKKQKTEVSQPSAPTEPMADETKNVESVSTHSNDPLLSGKDRLKLNELMKLCTILSQRVIALETTKTNQALEIDSLKRRSAQVVSSEDEGLSDQEDASKQGRKIADLDADVEVTLVDEVDEAQGRNDDNLMFDTRVFDESMQLKPKAITTAATTTTTAVTRPKARGVVVQEPRIDLTLGIKITPVLPYGAEGLIIMGDENLSTIPEKESDEFINSSVEDIVPIPCESDDTSDSDKECDLPFCYNFVTFSNPLFDANECFDPGGDIDEIDVFLEIDDSFPVYETFCFNIEEKSSGSTTTHSDFVSSGL
ncbi:putative ribonuclease H-like domain-containing protein [Tanacetum coccineum]